MNTRGIWGTLMLTGLSIVACAQPLPAQQAAPPAVSPEEQDVEVLLNTLNEVLEENRKIREELLGNEDSLQKLAKENNILRTQLRRIKKEEEAKGEKGAERVSQLEQQIDEVQATVNELRQENERLQKLKQYHEKRLPQLERETAKLHHLLDKAVLEGEREEYLNLIESAQDMASRSFEELASSKSELTSVKEEMSAAYYRLGNMLYDMKDFENAIESYQKSLEVNPRDAWVHHNLGIIYDYYIHDDKKALYHYQQYLQLRSVEEEAHQIRERILEMELKKNMVPDSPLEDTFYENYTKAPR